MRSPHRCSVLYLCGDSGFLRLRKGVRLSCVCAGIFICAGILAFCACVRRYGFLQLLWDFALDITVKNN